MQRLIIVIMLLLMAATSQAQNVEDLIEVLRSDIHADKVAYITEVMQFNEPEAEAFWPLYREYQFELDKLSDEYLAVIRQYADRYDSLDGDLARDLVDKVFSVKKDRLDLQKKYFKKISKYLTPVRAARWLQLENQLLLMLELQTVSEIPFVELPTK